MLQLLKINLTKKGAKTHVQAYKLSKNCPAVNPGPHYLERDPLIDNLWTGHG